MASGDLNSSDAEALQVQSDVLTFVLLRGGPTAVVEVEREVAHEVNGPYELDAVRCAVRDLAHAGLVRQQPGEFVIPTVAAVHMSVLSV